VVRVEFPENHWISYVVYTLGRIRFLLTEPLGSSFSKRLKDAYAMQDKHRLIFQRFSSTFQPETLQEWEAMILAWKNDKSKPNPYKEPASCP